MKTLIERLSLKLALVPVILALAGSMVFGYDGTPTTLNFVGSTTVGPIIQDIIDTADSTVPGGYGNMVVTQNGSSNGTRAILGVSAIGNPLGTPTCDIAMSSRELTTAELAYNVLYPMAICKDGVVVIVHKDLYDAGVTQLSEAQLAQIYGAGTAINTLTWDDVIEPGITNTALVGIPVIPRARITTSGTRETILEKIVVTSAVEITTINALVPLLGRFTENAEMALAINSGADGIGQVGYCGLGEANDTVTHPDIRTIAVADASTTNYVLPSISTILDGTYCLNRNLWLIVRTDLLPYANPNLVAFLTWMANQTGGQIHVANKGYICPVPDWDVVFSAPVVNLVANPLNCYVRGGVCNTQDLLQIRLNDWNKTGAPHWIRADITRNGIVNTQDLLQVRLTHWNQSWYYPLHTGWSLPYIP